MPATETRWWHVAAVVLILIAAMTANSLENFL